MNFIKNEPIAQAAKKMGKGFKQANTNFCIEDTSRTIQVFKDTLVGVQLGFDETNVGATGWNCRNSQTGVYLENKSTTLGLNYKATFQDTTLDKAERFNDNVLVANTVYDYSNTPLFCVVVSGKSLVDALKKGSEATTKRGVRKNVVISMSQLVLKFGGEVIALSWTPKQVAEHLSGKFNAFKNMSEYSVLEPDQINIPVFVNRPVNNDVITKDDEVLMASDIAGLNKVIELLKKDFKNYRECESSISEDYIDICALENVNIKKFKKNLTKMDMNLTKMTSNEFFWKYGVNTKCKKIYFLTDDSIWV